MSSRVLAAAICALMVGLSGCNGKAEADAARGIARFFDATQAGDPAAFEAAVDRPALRADLHRQIVAVAHTEGLDVGGPSEFALDRRITPRAFHVVDATGQALPAPPTAAQLAPLTKVQDRSHACVRDPQHDRCLLSFEKRKGVWRLVAMPAGGLSLQIAPPAAKN